MDANTTTVIVVVLLVIVLLFAMWRYGGWFRGKITGPGGMSVDLEGSQDANPNSSQPTPPTPSASQPGAVIKDSTSTHGGAYADDRTGRGAAIENTKTKDDLIASSSGPATENDPKAPAP